MSLAINVVKPLFKRQLQDRKKVSSSVTVALAMFKGTCFRLDLSSHHFNGERRTLNKS